MMLQGTDSIQNTILYDKPPGLLGKMANSRAGTVEVQKEPGTSCCTKRGFKENGHISKDMGTQVKEHPVTKSGQI